ncbi:translation initiation factor [Bacteroidia bacterium]|nr:translation initiation factor [Bacteroidia bacterium]
MSNNDWKQRLNIVYSTDPDFQYKNSEPAGAQTPSPSQQQLRVWIDRHRSAGKQATIVRGFVGSDDDLSELGRLLKSRCGVGGSVKEGEIIIQGDHRDKILAILLGKGYQAKKAGG